MEIFQTIWNVLTTENEMITNILLIPCLLIEIFLYMLIFIKFLKIDCTRRDKILYVLIYWVVSIISLFFIPSPYYTFINVLIGPVLVLCLFKQSILKSILAQVITYTVSFLINTPLIIVYIYLFKIPSSIVSVTPLYRISQCVISYLLTYLVYKLYVSYNKKKSLNVVSEKSKNPLLIYNFVIGLLAVAMQFYVEFTYIDYIPMFLIILSILVLSTYFIISLYSLFRTNKLETTTEKLKEEQLHNKTLTILYDNIRGFKHDFNNIVQGIGGYIATDNIEGLKEYYSQVLDDCQRVNNLTILTPEIINNPPIYSLLTSKYHKATELGIKVNLEIFMDLSNINIKIYEFTRILGILLDNAIEAAKDSEEKEINIIIRKDSRRNKQLFIIENTYVNKDVDIDKIFEKGNTSKTNEDSKNHGLGLWEVRQFVKKNYKTVDLYTTKDEKYFKQQFEIFC